MKHLKVALSDVTDNEFPIDGTVSIPEPEPGSTPPEVSTVAVKGSLRRLDTEYLFRGRLSGFYERPCDRCLTLSSQEFTFDVVWLLEEGSQGEDLAEGEELDANHEDDEDDQVRFFQGAEINLGRMVLEDVALSSPTKLLCREGCAGLCPSCGVNLNDSTCTCDQNDDSEASGFAGLADMFPDLSGKETEE